MNECKSGKKEKSTKKLLKYVTHIIKKWEIQVKNINSDNKCK